MLVSLMLTDTTFDFNNVLRVELIVHVKLTQLTNVNKLNYFFL